MRRRHPGRGLRIGVLLLALAAGTGCRGGEGGVGLPGERIRAEGFELRCDPGCGPEGRALVASLAQVRDSVATWFGADAAGRSTLATRMERGRPARIRLHASPASFQRADRRLASGRFAEQRAFSHARSRTAHILAEGSPDPARWRALGPGFQGERLVVHEAAHLVTYTLATDPRWPDWISEGVAALAEEQWATTREHATPPFGRSGREGGGGDGPRAVAAGQPPPRSTVTGLPSGEPWLDTQRHLRETLRSSGDFPTVDRIVRGETLDLSLAARYAVWARLFGVLLEAPHREATRRFLAELAGPSPAGGWSRMEVARRFHRHFDAAAVAAIEARLLAAVEAEGGGAGTASPTAWVELRRSSGWAGEGLLQVPVSEAPLAWVPGIPAPGLALRGISRGDLLLVVGVAGWEEAALGVRTAPDPLRPGARLPELLRVPLRSDRLPHSDPALPPGEDLRDPGGGEASTGRPVPTPEVPVGVFGAPGPLLVLSWAETHLVLEADGQPVARWPRTGLAPGAGWGVGGLGADAILWPTLRPLQDGPVRSPGPD